MSTPLIEAIRKEDLEAIKKLIAEGVNLNEKDEKGDSPLRLAVMFDNPDIVEALLDAKADPNIMDEKTQSTPIFPAAALGNQRIVYLLIKAGANVKLTDKDGATANLLASEGGHQLALDLLRGAGGTGE